MLVGPDDTGPVAAVPATPGADDSSTARIEPIADPVLDEPVPSAVTTVIPSVPADEVSASPPGRPAGQPARAVEPTVDDEPAIPGEAATPDEAEKSGKAGKSGKAAKSAAKDAAKAEKQASKQTPPGDKLSDLAVLKADSAARARVIAAVVAPFVIYVLVLLVLDALDLRTALIWIWVPLVTAGVVAGLILDLAHRSAAARAIAARERTPS